MSIENIQKELLILQEKATKVERAIDKGKEDYKVIDEEVKELLTRQVIEEPSVRLEEEILTLKSQRKSIEIDVSDNTAILENLKKIIVTKQADLHNAIKEDARVQYNKYAEQRKSLDESIESKSTELTELLDCLVKLDLEQRAAAEVAEVKCSRALSYMLEDFIYKHFKTYHRGLGFGKVVNQQSLVESDILNKSIE